MTDDRNTQGMSYGVEIHGPFVPEFRVTVDGYKVPYVNAQPLDDGRVEIFIDGRFGMAEPISRDEFNRWLPMLANAMAVAAGYSCHGENCKPLNLFKVRVREISTSPKPPNLTVVVNPLPGK